MYVPPPGATRAAFDTAQDLFSRVFSLSLKPYGPRLHKVTEDLTEDTVALTLNQIYQFTPPSEQGNVAYGICLGMICLATLHPTYVDRFLKLYFKAVDISPDHRLNPPISTLGSQILMQMQIPSYRTHSFWPQLRTHPGTPDPIDCSMLNYTQEEVENSLEIILADRSIQASEANKVIVHAAMFSRFAVLLNEHGPPWMESWKIVTDGLDHYLRGTMNWNGEWNRVDFIASLVRLRGYAKSVSEKFAAKKDSCGRMEEWQGLLKRWLYDPELNKKNDPVVKHHVLVSQYSTHFSVN